jgi:hypothetical protein
MVQLHRRLKATNNPARRTKGLGGSSKALVGLMIFFVSTERSKRHSSTLHKAL